MYLPSDSGPNFQCGIITATQYAIPVELEAGDDVIIMTSHHYGIVHGFVEPVVLYEGLSHVGGLPWACTAREGTRHLL